MAKAKKAANVPAQPAPAALPSGFKVKKQVILPSLSLKENEPRVLKIMDAMRVSTVKAEASGKPRKGDDGKVLPQKPATVCPVTDIQTGEMFTLIVPAVMEGNLKENYPDDSYVGCIFYVMKKPKRPGKRYFDFEISEVEAE